MLLTWGLSLLALGIILYLIVGAIGWLSYHCYIFLRNYLSSKVQQAGDESHSVTSIPAYQAPGSWNQTDLNWVKRFFLLIFAVLSMYVARSYFEMWQFNVQDNAAREQYPLEYLKWLESDLGVLVQELIARRGASFSPVPPRKFDVDLDSVEINDIALEYLLRNPHAMEALELHYPTELSLSADLPTTFGEWRFWESDDSLHTESIEPLYESSNIFDRGPLIPSSELDGAYIFREGTTQGDWLLHIPNHEKCLWLYVAYSDEICFPSLKSWLASSVVGVKSRWARLDVDESALSEEIYSLSEMQLSDAVREASKVQSSLWNDPPDLARTKYEQAHADWRNVVDKLGAERPPIILSAEQTFQAEPAYSLASALVRLWDGQEFVNLRLRPHDFEKAIVVLVEPYGPYNGQRVVQMKSEGRLIYVDLLEQRAFYSFRDWVVWAIARDRIWNRKWIRILPPNAARYPIG